MVYILLLIFVVLGYFLPIWNSSLDAKKSNNINIVEKGFVVDNSKYKYYFLTITIIMVILIAFRSVSIGTDTGRYHEYYTYYHNVPWEKVLSHAHENGYSIVAAIFSKLSMPFNLFLLTQSLLAIIPISYLTYKYSRMPWFVFAYLIMMRDYLFSFSGVRQSMAIGIILIGVIFLMKRKNLHAIFAFVTAPFFHLTSLVTLPLLIVDKIKPKVIIYSLLIMSPVVLVLSPYLIDILVKVTGTDYSQVQTGGSNFYIFLIGTVVMSMVSINREEFTFGPNKFFFYSLLILTCLFPLFKYNPNMMRINLYFNPLIYIHISNLLATCSFSFIKKFNPLYVRYTLIFCYLVAGAYMMYSQWYLNTDLVPYTFFFW